MKQNLRLFRTSSSLWSKFLDSNPQFWREIRGRLKPQNTIVAAALSIVAQFIAVIFMLGKLPEASEKHLEYGDYGVAIFKGSIYYIKDEFGHWLVHWQLWWLDLFMILSLIIISTLFLKQFISVIISVNIIWISQCQFRLIITQLFRSVDSKFI